MLILKSIQKQLCNSKIYAILERNWGCLVSTITLELKWQVECTRYVHKKINANKIKTVFSNMFRTNGTVAFA